MRLAPLLLTTILPLAVAAPVLAQAQAPAEELSPADAALAKECQALRDRGWKAQKEHDYKTAYGAYIAAWNIRKSYGLASNLGLMELRLGKYRDAAEHILYTLREGPKRENDPVRAAVERDFAEAKQHIGTLSISADTAEASVVVNGKEVGKAPLQGPVFVDPGTVVVEARHGDRRSEPQELKVEPGTSLDIRLTIPEKPPLATSTPAPKDKGTENAAREPPNLGIPLRVDGAGDAPPQDRRGPKIAILATGAGVAIAGLVVGLAEGAVARSAADDRDQAIKGLSGESPCWGRQPGARQESCSAASDADQRWRTAGTISVAGFVTAGVAAAGTLAYYFLAQPTRKTATLVLPAVTPTQAQIVLRSEF